MQTTGQFKEITSGHKWNGVVGGKSRCPPALTVLSLKQFQNHIITWLGVNDGHQGAQEIDPKPPHRLVSGPMGFKLIFRLSTAIY